MTALAVSVFGEDCTEFRTESPIKKTKDNNNFSGDILRYPLSRGKGTVYFFYVSNHFQFTSNCSLRLCFP